MTEQNSINFNSADFTISSGAFEANDAIIKSAATDGSAATPSAHVLTIAGTGGITTSGAGSTVTVDGSGLTSDYVFIGSSTASADASVEFTDLTSSYAYYVVEIIDVKPATGGSRLSMRTSTNNGGAYDSSGYTYCVLYDETSASLNESTSNSAAEIRLQDEQSSSQTLNATLTLYNPAGTNETHINCHMSYYETDGDPGYSIASGSRASAADVDAIQFLFTAGNITSGTFKLYGVVAS